MSTRRGLPKKTKMKHDAHYVDNLLFRDGEVVGRMLDISQIQPNPEQPRKDMGDIDTLADSIREQGVLEPLLVNKEPDFYMIISGERRYHASLKVGLEQVPCIIKNLDKNQIMEIALVENLQRKDLDPFEEADGLKFLSKTFNYTHDHIAKRISKSRSLVTEMIKLTTISADVRQAAREANVTAKSNLLEVAKLESIEEQLELIRDISRGAKREDVRRRVKKQEHAKPFVYKFRHPKKSYSIDIKFKKSEVERNELIDALYKAIEDLKAQEA